MRRFGRFFWRFMVIFSFLVNFILVLVLAGAVLFIFDIKQNIADPLIGGLHSTAAGLNEATIDWTIPVRDNLGIDLLVPINANTITSRVDQIRGEPVEGIPGETVVTLTRDVPLQIFGAFINSNDLTLRNATVNIVLPAGTELPVALDLEVGLQTEIPVDLDVRAVIPLAETQLTDPIQTLGLLFEPLAVGLHNLPSNWGEAGTFVTKLFSGELNLLATDGTGGINNEPYDPWAGYGRTAGLNYNLLNIPFPPENIPQETGIVPPGGIPALDMELPGRGDIYARGGVDAVNLNAMNTLAGQAVVPPHTYNGTMADYFQQMQSAPPDNGMTTPTDTGATDSDSTSSTDFGILPTPENP